jgi:pimeloyl-ACP methyl ester carboxylesterase
VLVDLVQTTTRDGLRLDGAYRAPSGSEPPAVGVDAFCLVHGTGGSFYSSVLFDHLADRLLALGCGVLRVNTRGHGLMSTAATTRGPLRQGAAYELVKDCTHDLAAWVEWLRQRAPRVGLIGHSLGAVKTLYALAHEPDLPVCCVAALSPPCLWHEKFRASERGEEFAATFAEAERLVAAGQPEALMEVQLPLPFLVTAGGYLEKYGPDEPYNFLHFLPRVACPALITLGESEVANNMAFQGLPAALKVLPGRPARLSVSVVPGADHFYSTVMGALAGELESWLGKEMGSAAEWPGVAQEGGPA